ncbi:MAG: hypothetical protein ACJ72Z_12755 [Pyrinomonadaceae bacterium]
MKSSLSGLIFAIVVSAFFVFPGAANGQIAPGGRVDPANVQYAFDAPKGWKRTEAEGGYNLISPAESVIVMVRPHTKNNLADAIRATQIDSTFKVVGEPQKTKSGATTFRVTKQTGNATGVVDVFVLMAPGDVGGVLVMALSNPANAEAAFNTGLAISESVTFTGAQRSTQQQSTTAPASSGSEWESKLAGKHLLYMYSGNGYFEEKHIYLCTDGAFVQTTGSGGYTPGNSDGGSFGAKGGRRGRWGLSGSQLVLQFQDGAVGRFNITRRQAGNEVGLNGNRYFISGNAGC